MQVCSERGGGAKEVTVVKLVRCGTFFHLRVSHQAFERYLLFGGFKNCLCSPIFVGGKGVQIEHNVFFRWFETTIII